jgi:hypothetical protein
MSSGLLFSDKPSGSFRAPGQGATSARLQANAVPNRAFSGGRQKKQKGINWISPDKRESAKSMQIPRAA